MIKVKKNRKDNREFKQLKEQLIGIRQVVKHTKIGNLWTHEASVRKKLKQLRQIDGHSIKGYENLVIDYHELLDEISRRLLEDYNEKNQTQFKFDEIAQEYETEYLSSGILTALVSSHIPTLMAEAFQTHFPHNPKDEYPEARALKRKVYLHLGQTNTGKTYQAIQRLKQSTNGIYLAPLRILALEIFERLNEEGISCDLLTGEEEVLIEGANHQSSTIEKLNLNETYEVAVIDEIQMIGDSQRGAAWTRALLGLRCPEIHLCGALNSKEVLVEILKDCGDDYEIIEYIRQVPLEIVKEPFKLSDAQVGDAFILFSKRKVLELAKFYRESGIKASVIYGDLPPEVRKMQYHEFIDHENIILVSTDAIGMGVNLPIRRIIFMNLQKFDGEEERWLTSQEVKQIAGRAGRKGLYEVGYVCAYGKGYSFLKEKIEMEDPLIEEVVMGPSEAILEIEGLPLKEKLALWSTTTIELEWYRKMDIRDYILILDKIRKYQLSEHDQWSIMKLPIDVHNEEIIATLLAYIENYFIQDQDELPKPYQKEESLRTLETYYQKVNLYYSFCKNFDIPFDLDWVYEERLRVSERINEFLVNGKY